MVVYIIIKLTTYESERLITLILIGVKIFLKDRKGNNQQKYEPSVFL